MHVRQRTVVVVVASPAVVSIHDARLVAHELSRAITAQSASEAIRNLVPGPDRASAEV